MISQSTESISPHSSELTNVPLLLAFECFKVWMFVRENCDGHVTAKLLTNEHFNAFLEDDCTICSHYCCSWSPEDEFVMTSLIS